MELHCKRFDELTTTELYEILRLRVDVFVAEQECARKEIDGKYAESVIMDGTEYVPMKNDLSSI